MCTRRRGTTSAVMQSRKTRGRFVSDGETTEIFSPATQRMHRMPSFRPSSCSGSGTTTAWPRCASTDRASFNAAASSSNCISRQKLTYWLSMTSHKSGAAGSNRWTSRAMNLRQSLSTQNACLTPFFCILTATFPTRWTCAMDADATGRARSLASKAPRTAFGAFRALRLALARGIAPTSSHRDARGSTSSSANAPLPAPLPCGEQTWGRKLISTQELTFTSKPLSSRARRTTTSPMRRTEMRSAKRRSVDASMERENGSRKSPSFPRAASKERASFQQNRQLSAAGSR